MRKALSLVLSAGLVFLSGQPAFAQVRAVAAESFGASAGRPIMARPIMAPAGSIGPAISISATLSPSFSAAPFWSAAAAAPAPGLSAASAPALAAVPAALVPAPGPVEAAKESALASAPSNFHHAVASLRALAGPAASPSAAATLTGSIFFDQARQPASAELSVAGSPREAVVRLQPSAVRKWGIPLAVASLAALGPLAAGVGAAGIDPHSAAFSFWSDVARGLAMAVPLAAIGGWGLFKMYRAKEADAAKARLKATPLHRPIQPQLKHFLRNLALGAIGIAVIATFFGPYINTFNTWVDAHSVGILHWLHVTGWKNVVASMIMLDFLDWCMHYASHRFGWLWRLHKVHHTDLDYDLSTTYRMHPLETAAVMLFGFLEFAIVGPNLLAMTIGDLIAIVMGQYQHANITMPEWLENLLSKVFMTSHKHYIHHSMSPDEYDSNYGHIFSFWDRLLGTFKNFAPAYLNEKVAPGIREYPNPQELTVVNLLLMPFRSQTAGPKKPSGGSAPSRP